MRKTAVSLVSAMAIMILWLQALRATVPALEEEKVESPNYVLVLLRNLDSDRTQIKVADRTTGEVLLDQIRPSVLASPTDWTLNEVRASLHEIDCEDVDTLLFVIPPEQSYSEGLYVVTITKTRSTSVKHIIKAGTLHEYGLLYDLAVREKDRIAFCSGWRRNGACLLDAMIVRLGTGSVEREAPSFMPCPQGGIPFRNSEGAGQERYADFQGILMKHLADLLQDKKLASPISRPR